MNIVDIAHRGYAGHARQVRSARATEYEAVSQISHRLRRAALNRHGNYAEFVSALSENRKLWTAFAIDVAQSENALPSELRAKLFYLAEFTNSETRRILKGDGDIGTLIEVNAALLQGLHAQGSQT